MLKKFWDYKKFRFLCVGSFNSLVDITTLNTLVFAAHMPVWGANIISVSFGITVSYFLNHRLVFRHRHRPNYRQFLKFFLITGIGVIGVQTAIIYLTRPLFNDLVRHVLVNGSLSIQAKITLNAAKVTAILVGMVWNYLFYSRVIFKKSPEPIGNDFENLVKLI